MRQKPWTVTTIAASADNKKKRATCISRYLKAADRRAQYCCLFCLFLYLFAEQMLLLETDWKPPERARWRLVASEGPSGRPSRSSLTFTSCLEASPLRWDHFYCLLSAKPIKQNSFINTECAAVKAEHLRALKGAVIPPVLLCGCHRSCPGWATVARVCVLQGRFSPPVNLEEANIGAQQPQKNVFLQIKDAWREPNPRILPGGPEWHLPKA